MSACIAFVAYGHNAVAETRAAYVELRRHTKLPVIVIGDNPGLDGVQHVPFADLGSLGRWAKLNLDGLLPYDQVLYMDADTRMRADITGGFGILDDGWDMAIAPSENQDGKLFKHINNEAEKEATINALGNPFPLQLQAGVFFASFTERTRALFAAWRAEWQRFQGQDQAALLRALDRAPVLLWILGLDWNSKEGAMVEHLFGRAR